MDYICDVYDIYMERERERDYIQGGIGIYRERAHDGGEVVAPQRETTTLARHVQLLVVGLGGVKE
jgi:hypothetical protein